MKPPAPIVTTTFSATTIEPPGGYQNTGQISIEFAISERPPPEQVNVYIW